MTADRDGTGLPIGDIGGEVRPHDTATGRQIWVANANQAPVTRWRGAPAGAQACRWSLDGSTLSVWGMDGRQEFTWATDPDAVEHPA